MRLGLLGVVAGGFLISSLCSAADWTEFRGPQGNGISGETGLPVTWSKDEHVAWRSEVPGKGWSSPILLKGRIYLTTAVPLDQPENGQSLRTLCLDALSGGIVWNKECFIMDGKRSVKIHGKNSYASPTPLTDGKRIFVHFGTHGTGCLDLDGNILWSNTELVYNHVHGSGGSPVLVGNRLILSCDGGDQQFVVALNANTGKIDWKTSRTEPDAPKKFAFTTPLALTIAGKTQIISPGPGAVCSYDAESGEEIWKVKYNGYSVIPKPVFGHGMVFVCTGYDRPTLLAIRPDGKGDVTDSHVTWKLEKAVPHSASLLLLENELYLISDAGVATCLDAATGHQLWQHRVGGNFSASPIFADQKIYLQDEKGKATVFKPGSSFEEIAQNDLGEPTLASYAIGDGALFIRTESALYRIQDN